MLYESLFTQSVIIYISTLECVNLRNSGRKHVFFNECKPLFHQNVCTNLVNVQLGSLHRAVITLSKHYCNDNNTHLHKQFGPVHKSRAERVVMMLFTSTRSLTAAHLWLFFFPFPPVFIAYTAAHFTFSSSIFKHFEWKTAATAPSR